MIALLLALAGFIAALALAAKYEAVTRDARTVGVPMLGRLRIFLGWLFRR